MANDIRVIETADKGRFSPVVIPQEWPDEEFYYGVGSPQVLREPDSMDTYLLFTGWGTDESVRHLFVADLDADLSISNPRKIADASVAAGNKIDGAYGQFDITNKEWVFAYTTPASDGVGLLRFSQDFSNLLGQQEFAEASKDSGASLVAGQNGTMWITWANQDGLRIGEFVDKIHERPLPSSIATTGTVFKQTPWSRFDVHHTTLSTSGMMTLVERNLNNKGQWVINPMFWGEAHENIRDHAPMLSTKPLLSGGFNGGGSYGHPHYTTELGRPQLFFDFFRNLNISTGEGHRHEIWATEPSISLTDPANWFPYRYQALSAAGQSDHINTFGAGTMVVMADMSGAGEIELIESIYTGGTNNSEGVTQTIASPSSSGYYKYVVDNPANGIRLDVSQNLNKLNIELRE